MDILSMVADATSIGKDVAGAGAGAVGLAPTHRDCSIELINESSRYTLCNPSVHTRSGFCSIPLPPTIKPQQNGKALFTKAPVVARGAVGVFTYDLLNSLTNISDGKIAIMYKVPFDFNLKSIEYAVGNFDMNTECNKELFRKMSRTTDQAFAKGKAKESSSLTHKSDIVTIRATMSTCYTPAMKIEVSDY